MGQDVICILDFDLGAEPMPNGGIIAQHQPP